MPPTLSKVLSRRIIASSASVLVIWIYIQSKRAQRRSRCVFSFGIFYYSWVERVILAGSINGYRSVISLDKNVEYL